VLLALAPIASNLHGIDLDAEPAVVKQTLAARGHEAKLEKGSVYALPYADATFDLVVSFSVFEHLRDYLLALREVARVLKPQGRFLLGMPAVNRMMEWGFRAIGFKGIEDHHVTTPRSVAREFGRAGFRVDKKRYLGLQRDELAIYYTWLLSK
jgi:SAM-dependent methyltransferase